MDSVASPNDIPQASAQVLPPSPEVLFTEHEALVESIVKAHFSWRKFLSMERDDLVQEGRLALYSAAHRFDPARGSFEKFASSAIRGAISNALRDAGEKDLESTCSLTPADTEALVESSHDSQAEARVTLQQLLPQLPERERIAIEMHHLQGHTKAAVAARLNCSERHVARVLDFAMELLQGFAGWPSLKSE